MERLTRQRALFGIIAIVAVVLVLAGTKSTDSPQSDIDPSLAAVNQERLPSLVEPINGVAVTTDTQPTVLGSSTDNLATSTNTSYVDGDSIKCSWSGFVDAARYQLTVTDDSGNVMYDLITSDLQATAPNLTLNYAQKYFCNITVIDDQGNATSDTHSSTAVIYDPSQAVFVKVAPDSLSRALLLEPTHFSGTVSYSQTYANDLQVRYYIKRPADSYFKDNFGNWKPGILWHPTTLTGAGDGRVDFNGQTAFGPSDDYANAEVTYEIRNSITGKLLASKLIVLGN